MIVKPLDILQPKGTQTQIYNEFTGYIFWSKLVCQDIVLPLG